MFLVSTGSNSPTLTLPDPSTFNLTDPAVRKSISDAAPNPIFVASSLRCTTQSSTCISLKNVDTPVTLIPPALTTIPDLAVIIPIESTFLTSSYVKVPPIETLPSIVTSLPNSALPTKVEIPLTFNVLVS